MTYLLTSWLAEPQLSADHYSPRPDAVIAPAGGGPCVGGGQQAELARGRVDVLPTNPRMAPQLAAQVEMRPVVAEEPAHA